MAGRPTVMTPEAREIVLAALRGGNTRGAAAALAGISLRTLQRWLAESEEMTEAVELAEGSCEASLATVAYEGAKTDPDLALRFLQRRFPQTWGRAAGVQRVEAKVVGKGVESFWEDDGGSQLPRLPPSAGDELGARAGGAGARGVRW